MSFTPARRKPLSWLPLSRQAWASREQRLEHPLAGPGISGSQYGFPCVHGAWEKFWETKRPLETACQRCHGAVSGCAHQWCQEFSKRPSVSVSFGEKLKLRFGQGQIKGQNRWAVFAEKVLLSSGHCEDGGVCAWRPERSPVHLLPCLVLVNWGTQDL